MPPTFILAVTVATRGQETRSASSTAFVSVQGKASKCFMRKGAKSRLESKAGRRGTRTKSRSPILRPNGFDFGLRIGLNKVTQPDPQTEVETIRAAAAVARQSDVAIVVVGENESTNREAWSEQHLGDRDSLDLLGAQEALIRAVVETGKPTIV